MRKYEFTGKEKTLENGTVLRQIRAVRSFGIVKEGDIGGWIEKESNLSHDGNAWVYGNARVYGDGAVGKLAVPNRGSCDSFESQLPLKFLHKKRKKMVNDNHLSPLHVIM